jgi:CRP-like cAMP-binding protein
MSERDLSKIELFADLPEATLDQLERDCVWIEREPAFVVIDEEQREPHNVFILADGEVEVYRRAQGGETISIGALRAAALFGEFSAIVGKSGSASVRTTTSCVLGEIPHTAFLKLVRQYPSVCLGLLQKMVALVRAFDEELIDRQPREKLIALAYHRYVVLGSL